MNDKYLYHIKKFKDYLKTEKDLSYSSITSYIYDLNKFNKSISKNILEVNSSDIDNFKNNLLKTDKSDRTIARTLSSLRHFYTYLFNEKEIENNPMNNISPLQYDTKLPEFLTTDEVEEFFSVFNENNKYDLRNKSIFELSYSSGIRISEIILLSIDDIDFENMLIVVNIGKSTERLVPMGNVAAELLRRYLRESRSTFTNENNNDYLFLSKKGSKLNRRSLWRLFKEYIAKTTIDKNLSQNSLRLSFAIHLVENDADLTAVQELLGHINIKSTQIYKHLANKSILDIHNRFKTDANNKI